MTNAQAEVEPTVADEVPAETTALAEALSVSDFEAIFTDGEYRLFTNEAITKDF